MTRTKVRPGMAIAALLAVGSGAMAEARDPTAAAIAVKQIDSVMAIAVSHPCAATALFYVNGEQERSGTLLLEGIPTSQGVAMLLDRGDRNARGAGTMSLRYNPYSTASVLVEVRWRFSRVKEGAFLFTTRAQLVDGMGVAIQPVHEIEPLTTLFVSGGLVQVLKNSPLF